GSCSMATCRHRCRRRAAACSAPVARGRSPSARRSSRSSRMARPGTASPATFRTWMPRRKRMLSRNDWRAHDALGLARLVAERQVTARELVERAIAEIEERNGALNAVVYRRFDEALAEAD